MTMTIMTQTEELINYAHIARITLLVGDYDGEQAYALYAIPPGVKDSQADLEDKAVQLCISRSENAVRDVLDKLKKWLANGNQPLFDISSMVLEE